MANHILLCSTEHIKARSNIFENTSDKLLREAIWESQLIYIEPILGTKLYQEILTEVANSTISADNAILLDNYIVPTLKFYALVESTAFVTMQFTPTGVKNLIQESSQELSQTQLVAYNTKWSKRAQFWAKKGNSLP